MSALLLSASTARMMTVGCLSVRLRLTHHPSSSPSTLGPLQLCSLVGLCSSSRRTFASLPQLKPLPQHFDGTDPVAGPSSPSPSPSSPTPSPPSPTLPPQNLKPARPTPVGTATRLSSKYGRETVLKLNLPKGFVPVTPPPTGAAELDEWAKIEPISLTSTYLQLSKSRLTALVTITALGGYAMAPGALFLSPVLPLCLVGTALMSASANSFNQFLESPYDAQMIRTQSRVLVLQRISSMHAFLFGATSSAVGFSLLYFFCNPLTAALGLANVVMYAGIYTPMKRRSVACTWVGAVVGAVPPLMGYTASCGQLDPAAFVLAAVLYSWQFPHFNGLSWNLRGDYSRAGYRVMCVTNQGLCRRTTLRCALALIPLCSVAAPLSSLTTWYFAVDSLPFNAAMLYLSFQFYRNPTAKSSRLLFRYTLAYLPIIMLLMIISGYGTRSGEKNSGVASDNAATTIATPTPTTTDGAASAFSVAASSPVISR